MSTYQLIPKVPSTLLSFAILHSPANNSYYPQEVINPADSYQTTADSLYRHIMATDDLYGDNTTSDDLYQHNMARDDLHRDNTTSDDLHRHNMATDELYRDNTTSDDLYRHSRSPDDH